MFEFSSLVKTNALFIAYTALSVECLGYGLDDLEITVRFLREARDFLQRLRNGCEIHSASCSMGSGGDGV